MPIVFSTITKNRSDGKVGFMFTDHLGIPHPYGGMQLPQGMDIEVFKAQKRSDANRFLKGRDLENGVYFKAWDFVLQENTEDELLDYAREEYRNNDEAELVPVANRITEWLNNGRFNEGQVRSSFNMSQPDFVQFRGRMNDIKNSANTVRGARGE